MSFTLLQKSFYDIVISFLKNLKNLLVQFFGLEISFWKSCNYRFTYFFLVIMMLFRVSIFIWICLKSFFFVKHFLILSETSNSVITAKIIATGINISALQAVISVKANKCISRLLNKNLDNEKKLECCYIPCDWKAARLGSSVGDRRHLLE